MINRTYVVKTPSASRAGYVDICVQAAMGTRTAPVADPSFLPPGSPITAPLPGWATDCGDGAYYEIRGRTLRLEHLAVDGVSGGFTPRANLGFILTLTPYSSPILQDFGPISAVADGIQLSASLFGVVGGDAGGAIPTVVFNDPVYGSSQPVVRVYAPVELNAEGPLSKIYIVNFSIMERNDEDYSSIGGP